MYSAWAIRRSVLCVDLVFWQPTRFYYIYIYIRVGYNPLEFTLTLYTSLDPYYLYILFQSLYTFYLKFVFKYPLCNNLIAIITNLSTYKVLNKL